MIFSSLGREREIMDKANRRVDVTHLARSRLTTSICIPFFATQYSYTNTSLRLYLIPILDMPTFWTPVCTLDSRFFIRFRFPFFRIRLVTIVLNYSYHESPCLHRVVMETWNFTSWMKSYPGLIKPSGGVFMDWDWTWIPKPELVAAVYRW